MPPEVETERRVAVVGAGPAGLTAAYFLRRLGHRVTVLDEMPEPGGMLVSAIPGYRLPKGVVTRQVRALERMEFASNPAQPWDTATAPSSRCGARTTRYSWPRGRG